MVSTPGFYLILHGFYLILSGLERENQIPFFEGVCISIRVSNPRRLRFYNLLATLNSCSTDFHAIHTSVHVRIYLVLASCRFTSCSVNHGVTPCLLVVTEVLQINRIVVKSTQEKIDAQQPKMKDAQQWVLSTSMQDVVYKESTNELISIKGGGGFQAVSFRPSFILCCSQHQWLQEQEAKPHNTLHCSACTSNGGGEYYVPTPASFR